MRISRVLAIVAVVAAIAAPAAMAFAFVEGWNPPDGIVGTPYNWQFKSYGGCTDHRFSIINGSLPAGLSLASNGVISGTPTAAGKASFWAQLDDACGSTPAQRPYSITITAKLTVMTPSPLAPATVGVPYTIKLTADGGGSQTWSLASGSLPAGLALGADGTISGTPAAATPSPVSFAVQVTDGQRSDTKTLTIDVVSPLGATAPVLAAAEVGQPLKPTTVTASGGRSPYAWSLGGSPPAWVAIDPATGVITGTPSAAGSFPLQVAVKDAYGTTSATNVIVVVKAKVVVKTLRLPVKKVGKLYRATLRTAGGVGPFTWKVTSGKFPVGIHLDRKTGVLSGVAHKAGTYSLTFVVKDALGATSEASLTLTILPAAKK